jgi:hypothetical protein
LLQQDEEKVSNWPEGLDAGVYDIFSRLVGKGAANTFARAEGEI